MMRAIWLLLLWPLLAQAQVAEPLMRARATLDASGPVAVGATFSLQVDVMTSSFFTQAPQLPELTIPGALVTPPGGRAEILHGEENGVALNGLRYRYTITPTAPGKLQIPALTISLQVGQLKGPQQLGTAALTLAVSGQAGQGMTAAAMRISQDFAASSADLMVGSRITRSITQRADGAQAMLITPADLADVPGFKRYAREPEVRTLRDRNGGFTGGERVDRADYVAEKAGSLTLPAVTLQWRDGSSGKQLSQTLPAQRFDIKAAPQAAAPFPIRQERQQHARWLWLPLALLLACLLARPAQRLWRCGRERVLQARRRWLASEAYAWRCLRRASRERVPALQALYRWLYRVRGLSSLRATARYLPPAEGDAAQNLASGLYGGKSAGMWQGLSARLPRWRPALAPHAARAHQLQELNPRSDSPGASLS